MLSKIIQEIINKVADEMGLSRALATSVYINYWKFFKDTVGELPDMVDITEEEFDKLRVNFNIPELGKFTTNYKKVLKANKYKKIVNEGIKNKERKTTS